MVHQEISLVRDGRFQMQVVVNNLFEIFQGVLERGNDTQVRDPLELRALLRQEAEKILASCQQGG
ncbi:MAG: hypothetical protein ACUVRZ_10640 [Desulfobacca sp.]|uniref:hypothetical protein n=1 Tax=Desulfobacca sp. TaxID=2067990 RepID=UPI0040494EF7